MATQAGHKFGIAEATKGMKFGWLLLALGLMVGCETLPSRFFDFAGPSEPPAPTSADPPAAETSIYPPDPFLSIEAGNHSTFVRSIDVDARGRFLVSGSSDKTVRVWDLETGRLLRVLRIPIGPDHIGRIYTVALSPDGATVAIGGWTGVWGSNSIYFYDRASGEMRDRIIDLPNVINHLTYSRDGRYLAAVGGTGFGLRVFETARNTEVGRDDDYGERSYGVDFDAKGRLVTASFDGKIRLYDGDYNRPVRIVDPPGGRYPFDVSFSPDGTRIAVGYDDSSVVDLFGARDLEWRYAADTENVDNGNLISIVWSADGRYLYAGGTYDVSNWNPIRRWADAGRGAFVEFRVTKDTVQHMVPLADGRLAFSGDRVAVLDPAGEPTWEAVSPIADFRDQRGKYGLRLSPSGDIVDFGFRQWGEQRARFSVRDARLDLEPDDDKSLATPITGGVSGIQVVDWVNTYKPEFNGEEIGLKRFETSRGLAIAADGSRFLLATDWSLRLFDADGRELDQVPSHGVAWSVNLSRDGRKAIAGFGDGTLRWYDISEAGQLTEVLALFAQSDGRWVAWTPEGFFDAGGGGENLIGYHLNQGGNQAPEFVNVDQLYDLFYRPDLVADRFAGEVDHVKAELARIGDVRTVLARGLPPELEFTAAEAIETDDPEYEVEFELRQRSGGVGDVIYRVNGIVIEPPGGRLPMVKGPQGKFTYRQPLPLAPGRNEIEVSATTENGEIESPVIRKVVTVTEPRERPPALYGIVVGINDYRDADLTLRFASPDAVAMAEILRTRGEGLFSAVEIEPLLDQQATLAGIEAAFTRLAENVKAQDVFILYLAGHGLTLDGRYHFFPQEFIYENDESVKKNSLTQARLARLLQSIRAEKSLVVLDTCQAGGALELASLQFTSRGLADKAAIARLMRATGRDVLAASTTTQQALEGKEGHGVFTYAILEGLKGQAQRNNDRYIDIDELGDYVVEQVPKITRELWQREQFPQRSTHRGEAYPMVIVE